MTAPLGSLFSGYGGLDLGIMQVLDVEPAWHVENERAPSLVLQHHWPHVPNLGDVTAVEWAAVPRVGVLCGGFPCQDVSLAGLRRGLHAGTRSGLWSHFATAIDALRPQLVIIENVRGLLSAKADRQMESDPWGLGDGPSRPALRALGAVLGDLAELGYDARWCGVRAADAGAPHNRYRIFVVAWPAADTDRDRGERWRATGDMAGPPRVPRDPDGPATDVGGHAADHRSAAARWGPYAAAVARWEQRTGRVAPPPTDGRRLSPPFVEWIMGLPAGHVTDPAIGLTRAEQLRALGNGVVPQQAALALQMLLR